jgi:hypothetical protein
VLPPVISVPPSGRPDYRDRLRHADDCAAAVAPR